MRNQESFRRCIRRRETQRTHQVAGVEDADGDSEFMHLGDRRLVQLPAVDPLDWTGASTIYIRARGCLWSRPVLNMYQNGTFIYR